VRLEYNTTYIKPEHIRRGNSEQVIAHIPMSESNVIVKLPNDEVLKEDFLLQTKRGEEPSIKKVLFSNDQNSFTAVQIDGKWNIYNQNGQKINRWPCDFFLINKDGKVECTYADVPGMPSDNSRAIFDKCGNLELYEHCQCQMPGVKTNFYGYNEPIGESELSRIDELRFGKAPISQRKWIQSLFLKIGKEYLTRKPKKTCVVGDNIFLPVERLAEIDHVDVQIDTVTLGNFNPFTLIVSNKPDAPKQVDFYTRKGNLKLSASDYSINKAGGIVNLYYHLGERGVLKRAIKYQEEGFWLYCVNWLRSTSHRKENPDAKDWMKDLMYGVAVLSDGKASVLTEPNEEAIKIRENPVITKRSMVEDVTLNNKNIKALVTFPNPTESRTLYISEDTEGKKAIRYVDSHGEDWPLTNYFYCKDIKIDKYRDENSGETMIKIEMEKGGRLTGKTAVVIGADWTDDRVTMANITGEQYTQENHNMLWAIPNFIKNLARLGKAVKEMSIEPLTEVVEGDKKKSSEIKNRAPQNRPESAENVERHIKI